MIRATPALLATCLCAPSANAQWQRVVDAPLRRAPEGGGVRGGDFGPEGWTTRGDEDTLWVVVDRALPQGRVEVTVSGLGSERNLTGALHDLLVVYGATDEAEPVRYAPFFRSNDFKVQVRVIGSGEPSRGHGASKLELRRCPAGGPGHHETCPVGCAEHVASSYLNGAPLGALPWNPQRSYRLRVEWSPGRIAYDRGDAPAVIDFDGTYAPSSLVVRLGSPRHTAGSLDRMPGGAVFSDLRVEGVPGEPTRLCDEGGRPGEPPDPELPACVRAVSLAPAAGAGQEQVFRAAYAHCGGADAFRIVQVWVTDEIAPNVPGVGANFEGGRFGVGASSCLPGEDARLLQLPWGSIDCARSSVSSAGDVVTVDWALRFDPAFAGEHGVWFDAKGGGGDPEPRLGWTRMGTYTVTPRPPDGPPEPDAAVTADAALPRVDGAPPATPEADAGPASPGAEQDPADQEASRSVSGGCGSVALALWPWPAVVARRRREAEVDGRRPSGGSLQI